MLKAKLLALIIGVGFASLSFATPVKWELVDFAFSDGGSASGSFVFDSTTNTYSNIDITTTLGSSYSGTHYAATAGVWGNAYPGWINAFSAVSTSNYTNAPWFRIDANIDFNAAIGTIVNQWLAVGAEGYCTNALCNSAYEYRETVSGYLLAVPPSQVPLPSTISLILAATLAGLIASRQRKSALRLMP